MKLEKFLQQLSESTEGFTMKKLQSAGIHFPYKDKEILSKVLNSLENGEYNLKLWRFDVTIADKYELKVNSLMNGKEFPQKVKDGFYKLYDKLIENIRPVIKAYPKSKSVFIQFINDNLKQARNEMRPASRAEEKYFWEFDIEISKKVKDAIKKM